MTVAVPLRSANVAWDAAGRRAHGEPDVPAGLFANPTLTARWTVSAHAASGVGSVDCHGDEAARRSAVLPAESCGTGTRVV